MTRNSTMRRASAVLAATALTIGGVAVAQPAAAANDVLGPGTELFVNPESSSLVAAAGLTGQARSDAQLLGSFPSANWFTAGTPAEVTQSAADIVATASADGSVPVLVAYNLPFRDCAQYSAGGATSVAEYEAWIDALAAGIGDGEAVVILEPDGLGIIPHYVDLNGNPEWCQPAEADPATAADERFEMLNHAVDQLTALPNTAVYLDGTHSNWLSVGDAANRLIRAGVEQADGFFLNASNYVATERLEKYGTWISECIHLTQNSWWQAAWCGSQYYPANPRDFSTWSLTDAAYDQAYADTGLTRNAAEQPHFVIDTSRNGQGPWTPPAGVYSDPEDWCNPPDRGLGLRPTTQTGSELIDAYLWIKVPGESDGRCFRGTSGPEDPERGIVDPEAGQWFPEQARELIEFAEPPVETPVCRVTYTVHGSWPAGFNTQLWIENTGSEPIDGWELRWAFRGAERVDHLWSGDAVQTGPYVSVGNLDWNEKIKPGKRITLGFIGDRNGSDPQSPLLFTLNGAPCTS